MTRTWRHCNDAIITSDRYLKKLFRHDIHVIIQSYVGWVKYLYNCILKQVLRQHIYQQIRDNIYLSINTFIIPLCVDKVFTVDSVLAANE